MADGEDELEAVEVDQKLSKSQKFALYKDLESYRILWDTSYVPSKHKLLSFGSEGILFPTERRIAPLVIRKNSLYATASPTSSSIINW